MCSGRCRAKRWRQIHATQDLEIWSALEAIAQLVQHMPGQPEGEASCSGASFHELMLSEVLRWCVLLFGWFCLSPLSRSRQTRLRARSTSKGDCLGASLAARPSQLRVATPCSWPFSRLAGLAHVTGIGAVVGDLDMRWINSRVDGLRRPE